MVSQVTDGDVVVVGGTGVHIESATGEVLGGPRVLPLAGADVFASTGVPATTDVILRLGQLIDDYPRVAGIRCGAGRAEVSLATTRDDHDDPFLRCLPARQPGHERLSSMFR